MYSVPIPNGHALALVLYGVVNNQRTLAISFEGSIDLGQIQFWPRFNEYYNLFSPLFQVLGAYVKADRIQQILVTGHSLGGAMVQDFMAHVLKPAQTDPLRSLSINMISGYTWGSPGGDYTGPASPPGPLTLAKLINFKNIFDPIPVLGKTLYNPSGTDILIHSPVSEPQDTRIPYWHYMSLPTEAPPGDYLFDTYDLVQRAATDVNAFSTSNNAKQLRSSLLSGDFSGSVGFQILPGSDEPIGTAVDVQDQLVLGGPSDDVFELSDQKLTLVPVIDGGAGTNALSLGPQLGWSCKTVGMETSVFRDSTKIALLFNIQGFRFVDSSGFPFSIPIANFCS